MVQWLKLATTPDLNSILEIHIVEGDLTPTSCSLNSTSTQ